MLHGDISNEVGLTVAFRCEDFLIKYKEGGIKNTFLNKLLGKSYSAEVDEEVLRALYTIYSRTPFTADLVIEEKNYDNTIKALLADLPFNRVILIKDNVHVSSRILSGDISYYVDDDRERRSLVNSEYAIDIDGLYKLIRRNQREY